MKLSLTMMAVLALVGAACSSSDETAEAAPTIVVEGGSNGEAAAAASDGESDSESDGESDGAATDQADGATDEEIALEFAQCMRDSGVPDFPDPTVASDGSVDFGGPGGPDGVDGDDPAVQDAFTECSDLLSGASFLPGADLDQSEIEDNLLAFAQCMRDLGFDLDDPDLSGGVGPGAGGPAAIFGDGFDINDPATADAAQECQSVFGPGFAPGGGN